MVRDSKFAKLNHVSNLTGSSLADINAVSLALPLPILLWSVLQSRLRTFSPYTPGACLVDFLLNCSIALFATTVYSDAPWVLNLFVLLPSVLLYATSRPVSPRASQQGTAKKKVSEKQTAPDPLPIKPFITHYRGSMIVITCIAILAVDFKIFPRRFAKVETWGTSLMDIGVGSFVFTSGVVSVRSSLKTGAGKHQPLSTRLSGSLRHSVPLFILGFVRLLSVKGLDYAEHVTEYGVHWNFFFTLGFLPPFVAVFQSAFEIIPSYAVLSFLLAAVYEVALDKTELGKFVLTAPRTNLISQNREGIFSFFGYLSIFLAGQSLGSFVLPREQHIPKGAPVKEILQKSILAKLGVSALAWSALFYFSISYYGLRLPVSRRLANLPYFLWVASYNSAQIALCYAIERLCFPHIYKASSKDEETHRARDATSTVLHAFNRNGLAVFLIANLLTGLVNLTVPTLRMGVPESMIILVLYISVVSAVALGLDKLDVSIKL